MSLLLPKNIPILLLFTCCMQCTLVFPHQLYREHPALAPGRPVILVEEWLFFRQYRFHQQKIVLHRASMQYYRQYLETAGYQVRYVETSVPENDIRILLPQLHQQGFTHLYLADPVDDWLERRLQTSAETLGVNVQIYPAPGFLNTRENLDQYLAGKQRFFQTDFYLHERTRLRILVDENNKPLGGKWSFDADNRKRFPATAIPPRISFPTPDHYIEEAIAYTQQQFPDHYGNAQPPVNGRYPWAWNHGDAAQLLQQFLQERLTWFGDYEDAMVTNEHFLYHSVLTPMLNTGLLEPWQVLDQTLAHASMAKVPLNALEGFVRQIMGWREFIRMVYQARGRYQRTRNYWGFTRKIPTVFWTAKTGIGPVDAVIRKVLQTGYSHHIERLMVMGNFFLLCEFDPDEVYRWFMEMYIDAYDWVMVPNVYGMTQFADGGMMTTKPYISGSNYLKKMGDWKDGTVPGTGDSWAETWDGLFWRFMDRHRDFFGQNPRLGMLLGTLDKMSPEKRQQHFSRAETYLRWLDNQ